MQFQLSGNTPVPLSQIAALYVDNARCGSDITFLFGDSGFILVVPAYAEGLYPVLTNALMFYVSAPQAVATDVTVVQILNSIPPPIAVQLGQQQLTASLGAINLAVNASTQIIPASISGTINAMSISLAGVSAATPGNVNLTMRDGTGKVIWLHNFIVPANSGANETIPLTGLRIRFSQGVTFDTSFSTNITTGNAVVNLYYAIP